MGEPRTDHSLWGLHDDDFEDLTRDGPFRYAAYLARAKKLLTIKAQVVAKSASSAIRYAAYSSDVGEALRPVLTPRWVNATYGLAVSYVLGDVTYHGYLEQQRGGDVTRAVVQATTFQLFASLLIPAVLIHQMVHAAQKGFQKLGRFTKWGPSVVGLACIPLMPLIDHPIEHAVDKAFDSYWDVIMKAEAKEKVDADSAKVKEG
mmetsp:Transcript_21887/g.48055  ORF Transcript_21887/g.48055 Transcript_21887/m.48055 type:complete len:204 (-) Transcript_21887:1797-2408(-)